MRNLRNLAYAAVFQVSLLQQVAEAKECKRNIVFVCVRKRKLAGTLDAYAKQKKLDRFCKHQVLSMFRKFRKFRKFAKFR